MPLKKKILKKREKVKPKRRVNTHWESAARLRLPFEPDPLSMSAAGRGGGAGGAETLWRSGWGPGPMRCHVIWG